jgi:hypothetical protein
MYEKHWASYRRHCGIAVLCCVLFVPVFIAATKIANYFKYDWITTVVAVPWAMISFALVLKCQFFDCPRCGKPFSTTYLYSPGWLARKCLHCGLPKYSLR